MYSKFKLKKQVGIHKKGTILDSFGGLVRGIYLEKGSYIDFKNEDWFEPVIEDAPPAHQVSKYSHEHNQRIWEIEGYRGPKNKKSNKKRNRKVAVGT
jgi:hypothetical protein